ncbi:hypothetical protein D3C86_499330 [compost metagenome]
MDADDVEAVEQVFAKLAVGDPFLQILVGGGDDPHVHLHRLMAADPVELAIGQHPQQPGLDVEGHVAYFVEKQGAAVGLLETAVADVVGAGEGPLLMAEQLGFDEILRDGRHVEGDEILVGARAVLVQGMGDQLLAGAALAVDQHRDAGAGQSAYGAKHLLHGGGLTDDLRGGGSLLLASLALGALLFQMILGAAHQGDCLVDVERLGQVFEGAALVGVDRAVEIRVRRHDDDGQIRLAAVDLLQQAEAVYARHADIGEDHVR